MHIGTHRIEKVSTIRDTTKEKFNEFLGENLMTSGDY